MKKYRLSVWDGGDIGECKLFEIDIYDTKEEALEEIKNHPGYEFELEEIED